METTEHVVKNGHGHELKIGMDVVLTPEWESLLPEQTFGSIRALDQVRGAGETLVDRVGVLWFGFGGLWLRHYTADQVMPARSYAHMQKGWTEAGGADDREEREAAEATVLKIIEGQGIDVLQPDSEQETIETILHLAGEGVTEQDVRDVIQDLRVVEMQRQRDVRKGEVLTLANAVLEARGDDFVNTAETRSSLVAKVMVDIEEPTAQALMWVQRHVAKSLLA